MKKATIFRVTATSLDDGHRCDYGTYASHDNAKAKCDSLPKQMEPMVIPYDCLVDDLGVYWLMPREKVRLSDDKAKILAKLTGEERAILGVFRSAILWK